MSGRVTPGRQIFDLPCARARTSPDQGVFVDDSAAHVAGACAAGWQAHRFGGADGLRADRGERGLP